MTPSASAGNFAPEGKTKNLLWVVLIIVVIVIVVVLGSRVGKVVKEVTDGISAGLKSLFEGLGIEDTPEEKENKGIINDATRNESAKGINSAWSPLFYKQKAGAKIFTQSKTDSLVKMLWDSVGYVVDSPEKFTAAIKQCTYKTQVSWLADNFSKKYDEDLLTWAAKHLDTSDQKFELATSIKYVDSLKSGF